MRVCGDYVVEVSVQSYNNPTNRCVVCTQPGYPNNPGCCDDFSMRDGNCTGELACDNYFTYCLEHFSTSDISSECLTAGVTSGVNVDGAPIDFSQPTVLGLPNPILLNGPTTDWQVLYTCV